MTKAAFREGFRGGAREIGFAVLTGHGVDPALYDADARRVLDLFTSTPLEDKMRFRATRYGSVNQGYFPIEETSDIHPGSGRRLGVVPPRLRHSAGARRAVPAEDYWPRRRIRATIPNSWCSRTSRCSSRSRRRCSQGLGVDPHLYDEKLTQTNFGLRLNYYPPMTREQDRSGAGRLLGHEDVDLFTILPASRVDGLQVWNHRSGKWVRMRAPHGSIIINTGDYMQRITNDLLPSTTHRVGKPTRRIASGPARVSFPIAVYVWENEILEVLPGLGEPNYHRSKPSPSTRAAPANSTATTTRSIWNDHLILQRC